MHYYLLLVTGCTFAALSGQAQSLHANEPMGTAGPSGLTTTVLTYAEQMPAFPGGDEALHRYLATQIKYPAEALRKGLSGQVVVQFVVDEQGRILEPVVAKTTNEEFNEEARRLTWLMPRWTPGQEHGQPVRVRCTLPIVFTVRH